MIRIRLVFWPSSGSSGDFGNPIWLLVAVVAAIGVIAAWLHPSNKDYLSTQTDLNRPQCIKDLKRQDGNETAGTRCNGTITNRGSETREYVVALTYRSSDDEQHYLLEHVVQTGEGRPRTSGSPGVS